MTFTAGEIRNPQAEPAACAGDRHGCGAAAVRALQLRLPERAAAARQISECAAGPGGHRGDGGGVWGIGAKLMAGAILVSTFGCVNGMLLAGARVYYAMSRDGLFFKGVGKLSATGVPVNRSGCSGRGPACCA